MHDAAGSHLGGSRDLCSSSIQFEPDIELHQHAFAAIGAGRIARPYYCASAAGNNLKSILLVLALEVDNLPDAIAEALQVSLPLLRLGFAGARLR